jgi:hypothetical protein
MAVLEKSVAAVQPEGVDIAARPALLSTTVPNMKTTIDGVVTVGMRQGQRPCRRVADRRGIRRQVGAEGSPLGASRASALARSAIPQLRHCPSVADNMPSQRMAAGLACSALVRSSRQGQCGARSSHLNS